MTNGNGVSRGDRNRLARLLQVGQITSVRVPSVAEEAARDLVRAARTSAAI